MGDRYAACRSVWKHPQSLRITHNNSPCRSPRSRELVFLSCLSAIMFAPLFFFFVCERASECQAHVLKKSWKPSTRQCMVRLNQAQREGQGQYCHSIPWAKFSGNGNGSSDRGAAAGCFVKTSQANVKVSKCQSCECQEIGMHTCSEIS